MEPKHLMYSLEESFVVPGKAIVHMIENNSIPRYFDDALSAREYIEKNDPMPRSRYLWSYNRSAAKVKNLWVTHGYLLEKNDLVYMLNHFIAVSTYGYNHRQLLREVEKGE